MKSKIMITTILVSLWQGSTHLGVGIAFTDDGHKAVIVANYSPCGNMLDQFDQTVLPLC